LQTTTPLHPSFSNGARSTALPFLPLHLGMAQMDFYALKEDIRSLFHFIFEETDLEVFEMHSQFDATLRHFRSFHDLDRAFNVGTDRSGTASEAHLALWSPSVSVKPEPTLLKLAPRMAQHFRYTLETSATGLIMLNLGGNHDGMITESCCFHWNETGARCKGAKDVDLIKWSQLTRTAGKIQRHVRGKMAVAKVRGLSRVVLPQAFASLHAGLSLKGIPDRLKANAPEIEVLKSATKN
jgi:hypothetical protein